MKVDYIEATEKLEPRASGMRLPALVLAGIAAVRALRANRTAIHGATLMTDQVVASGTNFLTTIIIGRACLPVELGRYTLCLSLASILITLPRCLIWTPYITFFPTMEGSKRWSYSGSAMAHQLAFSGLAAFVIPIVGIGGLFITQTAEIGGILIVFGPVLALMLMREYARRHCFAQLRAGEALVLDVSVSSLQIALLLLLAFSGTLTAVRAYMIIGMACALAVTIWVISKRKTFDFNRGSIVGDFKRNWHFARWLLVGELVIGSTAALDPWALSLTHGTAAVAVFAVAASISALATPLIQGFQNLFGPMAAHAAAKQGIRALYPLLAKSTAAVAAVSVVFVVGISYWAEDLLVLLYGSEYSGVGQIVTMFVVADACSTLTVPISLCLLAVGRSNVVLQANCVLLVLSLVPGLWFIYQFGPMGVAYTEIIASLGSAVWQFVAFAKIARNQD